MNALPRPAIAEDIWDMKYRLKDNQTGQPLDADIHATWARVAAAKRRIGLGLRQWCWATRFTKRARAMSDAHEESEASRNRRAAARQLCVNPSTPDC